MVKQGDFTVELVNATTKQPFKEHTSSNGETYVEVEPGVEYFIHVDNQSDESVKWDVYVDKQDLTYYQQTAANCECYCGIKKVRNGKPFYKALMFSKIEGVDDEVDTSLTSQRSPLWTGQVKVKVLYDGHTDDVLRVPEEYTPRRALPNTIRVLPNPRSVNHTPTFRTSRRPPVRVSPSVEDKLEGSNIGFKGGISDTKRVKSTTGTSTIEVQTFEKRQVTTILMNTNQKGLGLPRKQEEQLR